MRALTVACRRGQHRVADRVRDDVGVAVPLEAHGVIDRHRPQEQRPLAAEAVRVQAQADPHHLMLTCSARRPWNRVMVV